MIVLCECAVCGRELPFERMAERRFRAGEVYYYDGSGDFYFREADRFEYVCSDCLAGEGRR